MSKDYMKNPIIPTGYESIKDRKETGAHYTPEALSDFVAEKICENIDFSKYKSQIKIIDPSIGDGQLILSLLTHIKNKVANIEIEVTGFDIDPAAVKIAKKRIKENYPYVNVILKNEDFLPFAITSGRNDLFSINLPKYDIAISNPPYVRTQTIGTDDVKMIANAFGLSGRVDLYFPFIIGIADVLSDDGITGIITSNRFMTTKSGVDVRKSLLKKYDLIHIWDLGDTKLFEAAVLPSVLLGKKHVGGQYNNKKIDFTSIYSCASNNISMDVDTVFEKIDQNCCVKTPDGLTYKISNGIMYTGEENESIWRLQTDNTEKMICKVKENTFCLFQNIGKVRVGIKTTADKVLIGDEWNSMSDNERPELLFPLITHRVAGKYRAKETEKPYQVLYPYDFNKENRTLIDISEYPKTKAYLEKHKDVLSKRNYLMKSGRMWYEVWVPQQPNLWKYPKIVFRDISEEPEFWMDLSGSIVNGDCYWLTADNTANTKLLWLALAVGNSSFIEWYYDTCFNNKLYSGRRRFMTQYVEKFPIPDPSNDYSKQIVDIAKQIFENPDLKFDKKSEMDKLIWLAFGFSSEEISR